MIGVNPLGKISLIHFLVLPVVIECHGHYTTTTETRTILPKDKFNWEKYFILIFAVSFSSLFPSRKPCTSAHSYSPDKISAKGMGTHAMQAKRCRFPAHFWLLYLRRNNQWYGASAVFRRIAKKFQRIHITVFEPELQFQHWNLFYYYKHE